MEKIKKELKQIRNIAVHQLTDEYSIEELINFINELESYKSEIEQDETFSENFYKLLSHILLISVNSNISKKKKAPIKISPQVYDFLGV